MKGRRNGIDIKVVGYSGFLVYLATFIHAFMGVIGPIVLILYGIIPISQTPHFGRVYAAYGSMFIVLSLLWGWWMDGLRPDRFDTIGAILCLVRMAVIMYAPRG